MKRYELTRWDVTEDFNGAYTDVETLKFWTISGAESALPKLRSENPGGVFGLKDRWLGCEVYNWLSTDGGPARRWGGWLRLRGS